MRKNRLAFIVSVSLFFQGCSPVALEARAENDHLFGFEGIRKTCASIRGYFWEKTLECICLTSDGKEYGVFSPLNGGSCTPLKFHQSKCDGGKSAVETYLSAGINSLNKCLEGVIRNGRTSFSFEVSKFATASESLAMAREVDFYLPQRFLRLWQTPEELYFNSSIKIFLGKAKVNREFIEQIISPPSVTARQRYKITFVEPKPLTIFHTVGHPYSDIPKSAEIPDDIIRRFPVTSLISKVSEKILEVGYSDGNYKVGGDCRNYCLVEKKLGEEASSVAIRSTYYMVGVPFRDIVTINEKNSNEPIAFIQLNLSGGISSILFIVRRYDQKSDALLAEVEVYDRLWNSIGKEAIEVSTQVSKKLEKASKLKELKTPISNGLVLCETIDPEAFTRFSIFSKLRRGPFNADLLSQSGSAFGWFKNSFGSFQSLIDPFVELIAGTTPSSDAGPHGLRVAVNALFQYKDITFVPISMANCMKGYEEWSPEISRKGVKIVNFSGSEAVDRHWCKTYLNPDVFLGNEKPFLWVVAAGNSGTVNPKLRCPQSLGPKENLIVVAGGSYSGLWPESDYGRDYADIATSVNTPFWRDLGTSYSAARVSAVATEISNLFPELTPRDLKLSILAGAFIPRVPLEVRSGGVLDSDFAIKVAEGLSKLSSHSRLNLTYKDLEKILLTQFPNKEVFRRIELFKERKLIQ